MNRGFLALVLVVLGVLMLLVGLFGRPLFGLLPDPEVGAFLGFAVLGLGVVLFIAGMLVRLKAPKAMPDNEYDHDLPKN